MQQRYVPQPHHEVNIQPRASFPDFPLPSPPTSLTARCDVISVHLVTSPTAGAVDWSNEKLLLESISAWRTLLLLPVGSTSNYAHSPLVLVASLACAFWQISLGEWSILIFPTWPVTIQMHCIGKVISSTRCRTVGRHSSMWQLEKDLVRKRWGQPDGA